MTVNHDVSLDRPISKGSRASSETRDRKHSANPLTPVGYVSGFAECLPPFIGTQGSPGAHASLTVVSP
jgi:hypothetical protein